MITDGCFSYLAPSVSNVQGAIEHIYPLVFEFRKERSPEEIEAIQAALRARGTKRKRHEFKDDEEPVEFLEIKDDEEEDDFDSDQSHD